MNRANFHQSLATANILCNTFMVGTHSGWTAPAIVKLKNGEDGISATNEQIAWIASISEMSRFFGPLLPAIFLDKVGRKPITLVCSFFISFLWLTMAFARSITLICLVKMLVGVSQGVIDVISALYLAENCTPKIRGIMSGIFPLCYCTAHILEYILVAYESFTFVAIINAIIGLGSLSTCIFLKESPYYLVMKGRAGEAKKNLLWLRGKNIVDSDVKYEMDQIRHNMQQEVLKKRSLTLLFGSPENYKSLLLVSTFSFLVPMVGANSIVAYSSMIFKTSSVFSVKEFTIIYGVFQLASACISPFIIEKFNRRVLLLTLLSVMVIFNTLSFILYGMEKYIPNECFSWLIFATVTTFSIIFYWAFPLMVVIKSELLPMSVRAIGSSLNIMTSSIGASICIRLFIPIKEAVGIEYNFLFSLIDCILLIILIQTVLPETRGKTLVDIQMSFHPSR